MMHVQKTMYSCVVFNEYPVLSIWYIRSLQLKGKKNKWNETWIFKHFLDKEEIRLKIIIIIICCFNLKVKLCFYSFYIIS